MRGMFGFLTRTRSDKTERDKGAEERVCHQERLARQFAEGWIYYTTSPPPASDVVQFRYERDSRTWFGAAAEMNPETNVCNLLWRPVRSAIEGRLA